MKENEYTIMIVTPTYNRAYILGNLYQSLLKQTKKDFYWMIVDDGSTDNTEVLVKEWIIDNKIQIQYLKIENSGKSAAINCALDVAKGKLFFCVDSDDYLNDMAIEKILENYEKLDSGLIGMVAGMRNYRTNEPVTIFGGKRNTGKLKELYDVNEISGDTALIYKMEIITKYRFPQFENEKFVPENYLRDLLDREGELYIIKEYICMIDYLQDGYTKKIKKTIFENPNGYYAYISQRLRFDKGFFCVFFDNIRCVSINMVRKQRNILLGTRSSCFLFLVIPLAVLYYMTTFYRYEKNKK
ncbi:MAG: glycosyltransferase family 2 protein [Lachnospiraceae bacterium]|nr:glycosyltransferase family 2 protein [Lachnospiraceae bacterium]